MAKLVYLDNAAAMQPDADVIRFYSGCAETYFANAEAVHLLAYNSREALKRAGERLSQLLFDRKDYPVIWGESATELFRVTAAFDGFRTSAASALEHPALLANLRQNSAFTLLKVDRSGNILIPELANAYDLTSSYQVQSELGMIRQMADTALPRSGFHLVDAVQAAGKLPLDRNADGWIISGVKFGAPGGAAMLLAPDGRYTDKLLAHAQDIRHQSYAVSRINVPVMLTMVYALEKAVAGMAENFRRAEEFGQLIRDGAAALGIVPTLPPEIPRSPYILNLLLPEQESAVVVRALSAAGIFIASGSACSAESGKPSAALTALGFRREKAYRAMRISFGFANTAEDAEIFLAGLKKVLKNY